MLRVEFTLDPVAKAYLRKIWTPAHGKKIMWSVEKGLVPTNFRSVLKAGRVGGGPGNWPPLTHDYLVRKMRDGYPRDIWVRTGAAKRAVTQRIVGAGSNSGGRRVIIVRNGAGVVEWDWRFSAPAAGGRFNVVNRLRNLLLVVPASAKAALDNCLAAVKGILRNANFIVTGRVE